MLTELFPLIAGLAFGLTLASLLVAFGAYSKAMTAISAVDAMKNSTHSIQYVAPDDLDRSDKSLIKESRKIDRDNMQGIEDIQTDLDELAEDMI